MTSKQAINKAIYDYNNAFKNSKSEEILEGLRKAKKDLEILEIIKKWSFIQDNYKEEHGTFEQFLCNIHTIGMKEDFIKIKDWLL